MNSAAIPNEPISFQPLYKERVWGGRKLADTFGRDLPNHAPYGESWELCDRPDDQTVVRDGHFNGASLHELWSRHRREIFGGNSLTQGERFPLLVKILDAREDLSIQVHPPKSIAKQLGGQPKAECWFVAHAEPGSKLYVGFKKGVTRDEFEAAIHSGQLKDKVHAIDAQTGDFLYIPPGRLHAIGAGILIYEYQQNSDTTYRVYDWNRLGLDGKPRELHIEAALQCIDFSDTEPNSTPPRGELLVSCEHFQVEKWDLKAGQSRPAGEAGDFAIITVNQGRIRCGSRAFGPGEFFIIPAVATEQLLIRGSASNGASILRTTLPASVY